jgi:hypothetical protein
MYFYEQKNIYELFIKFNWKNTTSVLLIFSVPGCMRKCFVCDSDTQG